jgi:hypothetical protein
MKINPLVKDIFDFKFEDFELVKLPVSSGNKSHCGGLANGEPVVPHPHIYLSSYTLIYAILRFIARSIV